ncbi:MAG: SDR family NAD(P)-dependent oxidoreductase [Pseudomonadota bacterium]
MTVALVVGAGAGLSASLARKLAERGNDVVLASRDPSDLDGLVTEIGATAFACNAREPGGVTVTTAVAVQPSLLV